MFNNNKKSDSDKDQPKNPPSDPQNDQSNDAQNNLGNTQPPVSPPSSEPELSKEEKEKMMKEFYSSPSDWPIAVLNSGYDIKNIEVVPYKDQNNYIYRQFYYTNPESKKRILVFGQIWDNTGNANAFYPEKQ